ncbi:MAG: HNH endonuclease [Chloroflexota bacterium]
MSQRFSWKPKPLKLLLRRSANGAVRNRPPAAPRTSRISADTRLFVWQRDGGRCAHCGATSNLQFDHIIPYSWGGADTAENVELLCRPCNLSKGANLSAPTRPS